MAGSSRSGYSICASNLGTTTLTPVHPYVNPMGELMNENTTKYLPKPPLHSGSAILVDLDGTLTDPTHRRHWVEGPGKPRWDLFESPELVDQDPPIWPVIMTVQAMVEHHGFRPIYISGRKQHLWDVTQGWLKRYDLWRYPFELYLRGQKDTRSDSLVKRDILEHVRRRWDPVLVLDDRKSVVQMWRDQGLVCLQTAPGDF